MHETMPRTATTPKARALPRRLVAAGVALVCAAALLRAVVIEPFHVTSGSMAPALVGRHRACPCPRCAMTVRVGQGPDGARPPRKAFCPNCGLQPLPLDEAADTDGDRLLVNKAALAFRSPRRWEVVVFRLFGIDFIKRIIGLPGESVTIRGGDVYVDGRLARKTASEARETRVLVFDERFAPADGWESRWETESAATSTAAARTTLTYRHFLADERKCEALTDEHAYNGAPHAGRETVHDFSVDAVVELGGAGTLALRLCDGQDWVEAELAVGERRPIHVRAWGMDDAPGRATFTHSDAPFALTPGIHRFEMAFVDRRLSLFVDGRAVLDMIDLPEPGVRRGVGRPFQLVANGASVRLREFRLYRDVHYSQRGSNAVGGQVVHLGVDQYFVLGDNSPSSEDSRFWPDHGAVPGRSLLGTPLLVHRPARPAE